MKNQFNKNGQKHGYWEDYNFNGDVSTRGYYLNGKKVGQWESFVYQGRTLLMKISSVKGQPGCTIEEFAKITV